jgi:hypothetical protein
MGREETVLGNVRMCLGCVGFVLGISISDNMPSDISFKQSHTQIQAPLYSLIVYNLSFRKFNIVS